MLRWILMLLAALGLMLGLGCSTTGTVGSKGDYKWDVSAGWDVDIPMPNLSGEGEGDDGPANPSD